VGPGGTLPAASPVPAAVAIRQFPSSGTPAVADAPPTAAAARAPDALPLAATFFGVKATGRRFAYICDISGSMDRTIGSSHTKRIDVLRSELAKSIGGLPEDAEFFVCLFNGEASILGDNVEWDRATDDGKRLARRRMRQVGADGSTEPLHAFEIVFSLDPKPDAIYFMTDGEFDRAYARRIAALNEELHIPIHCITFVSKRGERTMQRIAQEAGGAYTHVPGPEGSDSEP
jgi:hypothetical protein